jgi:hypothetical protein
MHDKADNVLAVGLLTSPAWASVLQNVNVLLTTITLLLGIVWGVVRLWSYLKNDSDKGGDGYA